MDAKDERIKELEEIEDLKHGMAWLVECVIRDTNGTNDPKGWARKAVQFGREDREELDALRGQVKELEYGIKMLKGDKETVKEFSAMRAEVEELKARLSESRDLRKFGEEEYKSLRAEVEELKKERDANSLHLFISHGKLSRAKASWMAHVRSGLGDEGMGLSDKALEEQWKSKVLEEPK